MAVVGRQRRGICFLGRFQVTGIERKEAADRGLLASLKRMEFLWH